MANLRIVLTGGHAATAAIAVLEELRKIDKLKSAQIYWIGSKVAVEGKSVQTLESKILPKLNVIFYPITAGKLQTKFTAHSISSFFKIPVGFYQALIALLKIRPKVVLSFGGFASFPVVFWAYFLGIPVIIHEQTVAVGRAFKASILFARRILLAREESRTYFGRKESEVVGNPLTSAILSVSSKTTLSKKPTILVMGGSRGSNFLNELMLESARELLGKFKIIHLVGEMDMDTQDIFRDTLPTDLKNNYVIYESVDPSKMKDIYEKADVVIARSGANTVSELIYAKIPTIFIPLPKTYLNEQMKNANYGKVYGLGTVLTETEATPDQIVEEVYDVIKNWNAIKKNLENKNNPDIDASKKIAAIVSQYC